MTTNKIQFIRYTDTLESFKNKIKTSEYKDSAIIFIEQANTIYANGIYYNSEIDKKYLELKTLLDALTDKVSNYPFNGTISMADIDKCKTDGIYLISDNGENNVSRSLYNILLVQAILNIEGTDGYTIRHTLYRLNKTANNTTFNAGYRMFNSNKNTWENWVMAKLNADTLSDYTLNNINGLTIYNISNTGCIICTNLTVDKSRMILAHIIGNTYMSDEPPVNTIIQFYYTDNDIRLAKAINFGANLSQIKLFIWENYICFWLPYIGIFNSYIIKVYDTYNNILGKLSYFNHDILDDYNISNLKLITPISIAKSSTTPSANYSPIYDTNGILNAGALTLTQLTLSITDEGWYRIYSYSNAIRDHILLNLNRNLNGESVSLSISISANGVDITQLSGVSGLVTYIDKIRVCYLRTSPYGVSVDFHLLTNVCIEIKISGIGCGKFQKPELVDDVPDEYLVKEFELTQGFKPSNYELTCSGEPGLVLVSLGANKPAIWMNLKDAIAQYMN